MFDKIIFPSEIPRDTKETDFCKEETLEELKWARTLKGQNEEVACPKGVTGENYQSYRNTKR